jgi:hypothetical protein
VAPGVISSKAYMLSTAEDLASFDCGDAAGPHDCLLIVYQCIRGRGAT